jgi:HK97 gp10 family phage protein
MKVEFDITEVEGNLKKLLQKLPEATVQVMRNATLVVEEQAKENCPVDTGTLRSSISSEVDREGKDIVGYVYTNEKYAIHVHFGTGIFSQGSGRGTAWKFKDRKGKWHSTLGQKATPFLQDAINQKQGEVINELKKVLDYV